MTKLSKLRIGNPFTSEKITVYFRNMEMRTIGAEENYTFTIPNFVTDVQLNVENEIYLKKLILDTRQSSSTRCDLSSYARYFIETNMEMANRTIFLVDETKELICEYSDYISQVDTVYQMRISDILDTIELVSSFFTSTEWRKGLLRNEDISIINETYGDIPFIHYCVLVDAFYTMMISNFSDTEKKHVALPSGNISMNVNLGKINNTIMHTLFQLLSILSDEKRECILQFFEKARELIPSESLPIPSAYYTSNM